MKAQLSANHNICFFKARAKKQNDVGKENVTPNQGKNHSVQVQNPAEMVKVGFSCQYLVV